ncbi:uncharacterized protein MYCGRDRAFT_88613 [Zymoseptoria tritici IPO323]|uniref:Uncharacterized protein n=1 Tax=Zymoseptoria tritici (strain CBS 115943 / IPO323) TaxID=336722 RepID=F9WXE1_ZYMTI|nr:uncharacterized protein MYCGRDRAFT_88613 [Zymoseptoria tritici IPO323]EGP90818.1 hypothetical protein MYCGRDRAFT_88613 [Zymoseptoria tritici IPO323]
MSHCPSTHATSLSDLTNSTPSNDNVVPSHKYEMMCMLCSLRVEKGHDNRDYPDGIDGKVSIDLASWSHREEANNEGHSLEQKYGEETAIALNYKLDFQAAILNLSICASYILAVRSNKLTFFEFLFLCLVSACATMTMSIFQQEKAKKAKKAEVDDDNKPPTQSAQPNAAFPPPPSIRSLPLPIIDHNNESQDRPSRHQKPRTTRSNTTLEINTAHEQQNSTPAWSNAASIIQYTTRISRSTATSPFFEAPSRASIVRHLHVTAPASIHDTTAISDASLTYRPPHLYSQNRKADQRSCMLQTMRSGLLGSTISQRAFGSAWSVWIDAR